MKMKNAVIVLAIVLFAYAAGQVNADTHAYAGSTSWNYGWNTASNWVPAGVPEAGDNVTIGGSRKPILDTSTPTLGMVYVAYTYSTTAADGYLRIYGSPNFPAYTGALNADTIYVSYVGGSTGFIQQMGGTVTANNLSLKYNKGTGNAEYYLQGGTLTTTTGNIGSSGKSTFNHSSGTYNSTTINLGVYNYASYGTESDVAYYNMTGGTVNVSGNFNLGYYSEARGHLKMGNDTGATGTVTGTGNLIIKNGTHASGLGIVQGFGDITMTGALTNNGKVIADGWGGANTSDRTLTMADFSSISTVEASQMTDAGWYAQNRGKLVLPTLAVSGGSSTAYFGEDSANNQKLVNSMKLAFDSVTGGNVGISLLAGDNSEVGTLGDEAKVIGIWKIDGSSFDFGSGNVDLNIRYDSTLASTLGITESDLKLYHQVNGAWVDVTSDVDTTNKFISADNVDSFSLFAVGTNIVPEPATLGLLAFGTLAVISRRKRK